MANFLLDGFSTTISFPNNPGILGGGVLYEKEVTPPGLSGGGPIDTTGMRNIAWRTRFPKTLTDLTEIDTKVAYKTTAYLKIKASMQKIMTIQVNFPDGNFIQFYCWIEEFKPEAVKEGDQPMASMKIIPALTNIPGQIEQGPVLTVQNP